MGSPKTFAFLWENESFSKERHILSVLPFSDENFIKLKARESILIQEAWKKYGIIGAGLDQFPQGGRRQHKQKNKGGKKLKALLEGQTIESVLTDVATAFRVNTLCLNMTDGVPRKHQRGYDVYVLEKQKLAQRRGKKLIKQQSPPLQPQFQLKMPSILPNCSYQEQQRRSQQGLHQRELNHRKSRKQKIDEADAGDRAKMNNRCKELQELHDYRMNKQSRYPITTKSPKP